MRKRISAVLGLRLAVPILLVATPLLAQQPFVAERIVEVFSNYEFFAAVIAGIVLAIGFQLLLTNLAGAAGLSAARAVTDPDQARRGRGDRERGGKGRAAAAEHEPERERHPLRSAADKVHQGVRSVNAGFGMWAVLTSVISLFLAAMLAVGMTYTLDVLTAVVIGLVIWSFGYLATLTLESLAGSTMVAGLAGVAKTSAKSLQELTAKVFGAGEEKQVADNARAITEAVRDELFGDADIRKQLNGLIDRVKSGTTSRDFRNELEKLLNDVEVQSVLAGTEREKIISDVHTGSALLGRERAKNVANRLREIVTVYRQESQTAKAPSEQVADTAARAAGLNAYEAEEYRRKLEDYLRRTGREELNPEGIKRDLERLFHDPRGGAEALKNRLMAIDRNTVAAVLASRTDLNEGEARQRVDQVMGVVERITGRARQQAAGAQEQAQAAMGSAQSSTAGAEPAAPGQTEKALQKVESYLATLDEPAPHLDPEEVRREVELLLSDPRLGSKALYQRVKSLDREEIKTLVSSNRYIDREDVDRVVDGILAARDQAMARFEQFQQEVERRMEQAREEALHQADEVRKTMASAAWWMAAAAICSGVAAALGGWVGTYI